MMEMMMSADDGDDDGDDDDVRNTRTIRMRLTIGLAGLTENKQKRNIHK
jgi:hypothetical protein